MSDSGGIQIILSILELITTNLGSNNNKIIKIFLNNKSVHQIRFRAICTKKS